VREGRANARHAVLELFSGRAVDIDSDIHRKRDLKAHGSNLSAALKNIDAASATNAVIHDGTASDAFP
jgi:hypothetical protein